jgi:two-component system, cell cycle response regulator DivK
MEKRRSILIIDDDSKNIFALSAVLKARGYHCTSATSAEEGFAMLRGTNEVGVILLDMMMPDTDGYAMLEIIREDQELNKLPVIAVTAQAMSGDRERCLDAGADDYVSKPVDIDKLEVILKKLI